MMVGDTDLMHIGLATSSQFLRQCMLAIALFLGTDAARGGELRELIPVDGVPFPARLQGVDADWKLRFSTDGGTKILQAGDLVRWGTLPAMPHGDVLLLVDGGQLAGSVARADREQIQLESPVFGNLTLPISQVIAVVRLAPSVPEPRDVLLSRITQIREKSDWLLLENGDELTGSILSLTQDSVQLESNIGPAPIEMNRVRAIIFNPALHGGAPRSGLRAIVGFQDGSWFQASEISAPKAPQGASAPLAFTSSGGWRAEALPDDLVFIQPLGGRAEYLSDLDVQSYKHIPFVGLPWSYQRDRSACGGLLRLENRVYPKGIGMHSASRITYALRPEDRRFQAEIALDATSGTRGSVRFRVFVDNDERFASPVVRGGDPPTPISVDVRGGKRLSLLVDFADRGDELDRANWLDARLVH
jgi:hypothetical protein